MAELHCRPGPAARTRALGVATVVAPVPRRGACERLGELRRGREAVGRQLLERGEHRRLDLRRDRVPLRRAAAAGVSVITRATMACAVGPVNGGSPVSIS